MESDPTFVAFISSRKTVLERLEMTRLELEQWLDEYAAVEPGIVQLARLQGLLEERRKGLAQLIKLDDDLLGHLVVYHTRAQARPSSEDGVS